MTKRNYMYERIFYSYQCRNYIKACKEIAEFFQEGCCETSVISKKYKEALYDYRQFLDSLGVNMPMPIIRYHPGDKSTWKFLTIKISNYKRIKYGMCGIEKQYAGSVLNPNWKGHKDD